jgi:F0F1-type ATP synthase assembly protein I
MQKKYARKIIGTSLMTIMIISLSLVGFSYAQAQFLDLKKIANVDGIIDSISATSLTLHTNGSESIVFNINNHTVFTQNMTYLDFSPGESVKVIAKIRNHVATAKVIKKIGSAGYGCHGDHVFIRTAEITNIDGDTVTISSDLAIITFRISAATWFVNTPFADLVVGDRIQVNGYDSGVEFLANAVYRYNQ